MKRGLIAVILAPYLFSLLLFLFFPNLKTEISISDGIGRAEGRSEIETFKLNKDSLLVFVQIDEFSPTRGIAELKAYPWPNEGGGVAFSSSAFFEQDIRIVMDQLDPTDIFEFPEGSQVGAIPFTVDVLSLRDDTKANDFFYPFDNYELDTHIWVWQKNARDEWVPIPAIEDFYDWNPLPGFDIAFERTSLDWRERSENVNSFRPTTSEILQDRENGEISFFAKISRSKASFAITILITIFCLICSIALVSITYEVIKKRRPPSTQVLVWAAATALGEIQLRDLLPGSPRIGIAFDLIVLFPSLLISILVVAFTSILWMRREDFAN